MPKVPSLPKEITRGNVRFPLSALNLMADIGTSQFFLLVSQRSHLKG